ncbi:MAG: pilus assembly PilX N-terminal domain-containing protein [Patescibacteria group bacterium]
MTNIRNNSGVVLVYSLLVMGLLTAIALTVSLVIINELRLTSSATDGSLAYYAAESGIERGLYGIKTMRSAGVVPLSTAVATIAAYADTFTSNSAVFDAEQTESSTSLIVDRYIGENEYAQADYYNADDPLSPSNVDHVVVSNNGTDPNSWAEVSWIGWDNTGTLGTSVSAKKVIGSTDLSNGWSITLASAYSGSPVGYRLRIRALFGPLSSFSVIPYDSSNNIVTNLPSQVIIKSVGRRNSFKQALTATVPWRIPLSGLYDYVLFSEGELEKNIILSKAIYSSGVIQVEEAASGTCANCAVCQSAGWLASACTPNVSCASGNPFMCTLPTVNDSFTLPIPAGVVSAQELYLSLRFQSASTNAEVTIADPSEGEVGFTFNPSSAGVWKTCTIPESFSLGSITAGRSIMFRNLTVAAVLQVDWYQISSYKIFSDCPTS